MTEPVDPIELAAAAIHAVDYGTRNLLVEDDYRNRMVWSGDLVSDADRCHYRAMAAAALDAAQKGNTK